MGLAGKTILITGAAGGLGAALALACAGEGAELFLLDKDRRALGELSDRVTAQAGSSPGLYPLDLAGAGIDEFNALVEIIQSEFGNLRALIHCAVEFDGLRPLHQVEPQQWLRSIQVNVNAPWLLSCACLPLLKASQSGRLFFLMDDIDKVSGAYWGPYGTSKAALAGLIRQFNEELSNTNVVVKGIDPRPMRTRFRAKVYHAENPLDQPEPSIAARKITAMLTGELSADEVIVQLFK